MRFFFLFFSFLLSTVVLSAQKHDHIWLFGYDSNEENTIYGGTIIDFNSEPLSIEYEFRELNFRQTNSSICDAAGNLLFYTNGISIHNYLNELIENGDNLNPGIHADNNQEYGYILTQGVLILPVPESDAYFYLIHVDREKKGDGASYSKHLHFSLVDMNGNNQRGQVVKKNEVILDNCMEKGQITATKHANGRDWWIVIREFDTNQYFQILVTPDSIYKKGEQSIGTFTPSPSIGQAIFSPDGKKYANLNISGPIGSNDYLNIYDFDSCTGQLSNPIQITYADSAWAGGVAISPNSRFLYVSSYRYLYQYDLWSDNIPASKDTIAIYDGFLEEPIFKTRFFLSQLAPNGKIYINTPSTTHYLHIINQPDLPGDSCDVCQHCLELPTWNSFSLPNFPNYRLQHLEGSPCDTLRQPPTAAFDYEIIGNEVHFVDSSYHDIRSWQWDFGDGQVDSVTHSVTHSVHGYAESGVYEVCLEVENPRGRDTLCQGIEVVVTGVEDVAENKEALVSVFPNPVEAELKVQLNHVKTPVHFYLYNALGQEVTHTVLQDNLTSLDVTALSNSVYWWRVESQEGASMEGKVVKE